MSGLLGQIVNGVMGGQQGQASPVAGIIQQLLVSRDGSASAISALVARFQGAGLGNQAQSWVGAGANQPITPEHVAQAFSPAEIEGWAQQAGTTPDALRAVLAQAIPRAIDHVTPGGQMPSQGADLSALLAQFLGSSQGAPRPGSPAPAA